MWEELERYRNHYLQKEIQDIMKPSSINCQQNKGNVDFAAVKEYSNCI